jgi:hypothetical protein
MIASYATPPRQLYIAATSTLLHFLLVLSGLLSRELNDADFFQGQHPGGPSVASPTSPVDLTANTMPYNKGKEKVTIDNEQPSPTPRGRDSTNTGPQLP